MNKQKKASITCDFDMQNSDHSSESILIEERVNHLLDIDHHHEVERRNIFNNAGRNVPPIRRSVIGRTLRNRQKIISSTPMVKHAGNIYSTDYSLNLSPIDRNIDVDEEGIHPVQGEIKTTEQDVVIVDSSDERDANEGTNESKKYNTRGRSNQLVSNLSQLKTRDIESAGKYSDVCDTRKEDNSKQMQKSPGRSRNNKSGSKSNSEIKKNGMDHNPSESQLIVKLARNSLTTLDKTSSESLKRNRNISMTLQSDTITAKPSNKNASCSLSKCQQSQLLTSIVETNDNLENAEKILTPAKNDLEHDVTIKDNTVLEESLAKKNITTEQYQTLIRSPQMQGNPSHTTPSISRRQLSQQENLVIGQNQIIDQFEYNSQNGKSTEERVSKIPILRTRSKSRENVEKVDPVNLRTMETPSKETNLYTDEEVPLKHHKKIPPKPQPRRKILKKPKTPISRIEKNNDIRTTPRISNISRKNKEIPSRLMEDIENSINFESLSEEVRNSKTPISEKSNNTEKSIPITNNLKNNKEVWTRSVENFQSKEVKSKTPTSQSRKSNNGEKSTCTNMINNRETQTILAEDIENSIPDEVNETRTQISQLQTRDATNKSRTSTKNSKNEEIPTRLMKDIGTSIDFEYIPEKVKTPISQIQKSNNASKSTPSTNNVKNDKEIQTTFVGDIGNYNNIESDDVSKPKTPVSQPRKSIKEKRKHTNNLKNNEIQPKLMKDIGTSISSSNSSGSSELSKQEKSERLNNLISRFQEKITKNSCSSTTPKTRTQVQTSSKKLRNSVSNKITISNQPLVRSMSINDMESSGSSDQSYILQKFRNNEIGLFSSPQNEPDNFTSSDEEYNMYHVTNNDVPWRFEPSSSRKSDWFSTNLNFIKSAEDISTKKQTGTKTKRTKKVYARELHKRKTQCEELSDAETEFYSDEPTLTEELINENEEPLTEELMNKNEEPLTEELMNENEEPLTEELINENEEPLANSNIITDAELPDNAAPKERTNAVHIISVQNIEPIVLGPKDVPTEDHDSHKTLLTDGSVFKVPDKPVLPISRGQSKRKSPTENADVTLETSGRKSLSGIRRSSRARRQTTRKYGMNLLSPTRSSSRKSTRISKKNYEDEESVDPPKQKTRSKSTSKRSKSAKRVDDDYLRRPAPSNASSISTTQTSVLNGNTMDVMSSQTVEGSVVKTGNRRKRGSRGKADSEENNATGISPDDTQRHSVRRTRNSTRNVSEASKDIRIPTILERSTLEQPEPPFNDVIEEQDNRYIHRHEQPISTIDSSLGNYDLNFGHVQSTEHNLSQRLESSSNISDLATEDSVRRSSLEKNSIHEKHLHSTKGSRVTKKRKKKKESTNGSPETVLKALRNMSTCSENAEVPSVGRSETNEYIDVTLNEVNVRLKFMENEPNFRYRRDNHLASDPLQATNGSTTGFLKLPPSVIKPPHLSKKHILCFFVVQGKGEIRVQNCTSKVKTLSRFIVPVGIEYSITNESQDEPLILGYVRMGGALTQPEL